VPLRPLRAKIPGDPRGRGNQVDEWAWSQGCLRERSPVKAKHIASVGVNTRRPRALSLGRLLALPWVRPQAKQHLGRLGEGLCGERWVGVRVEALNDEGIDLFATLAGIQFHHVLLLLKQL
jgi:hypothetical protein